MYTMGVHLPKLKKMRLRKAISQGDLAKLAGVTRSTVIRAESGGTTSFRNAHKFAEALGVSVEDLQADEEPDAVAPGGANKSSSKES